ncbi:MAG: hypothetical protein HC772_07685 [Leptolyngbyaceae cyanobacterium CRU_2_3]|nr:hypothetical protein [Leptolyngbyaceae cyanobacterium CRU_2_3]
MANNAWAEPTLPMPPAETSQVQSSPTTASQLGTPAVSSEASTGDRSQQLNQQAETINQALPNRQTQRPDPIQRVLGLPETVRIRPTRSGVGVTTQF